MNAIYDKKWSPFQITMALVCFVALALTLSPLLNVLAISLSGKDAIAKGVVGLWPVDFTLQAYDQVFGNGSTVYSMFYSLGLTLLVGGLTTFLTILAAYPLSKLDLKGGRFCMTLITITMYISAGTIPSYLLVKNLGLMNSIWALILPGLISPFQLIILRSFFLGINKSLFEAAYMDGCGEWGCLFRIAVPLSTPSISTIMLFSCVGRWNGITDVLYYIQNPKLYTLQYNLKLLLDSFHIEYTPEEMAEMTMSAENVKSATILFSMIPILVVYPFVQKFFTKGINIGGVKE
jgi:putative aldouronate transport system permease protein